MKATTYYRGLDISGIIVDAGFEGDESVPGGTRHLGYYVDDMSVCSPDGDDITDMISDEALEECENALLEDCGDDVLQG